MVIIFQRETGHVKLFKPPFPRLVKNNDGKSIFCRNLQMFMKVANKVLKYTKSQFLGLEMDKQALNFKIMWIKSKISNSRIWVNILCQISHQLVAQRLDLPLKILTSSRPVVGASFFRKNWKCLNHFFFDFILFGCRMLNIFQRETGHVKLFKQLYPRLVKKKMDNRFLSKFANFYEIRK